METATRALILASLFVAGCSGDVGSDPSDGTGAAGVGDPTGMGTGAGTGSVPGDGTAGAGAGTGDGTAGAGAGTGDGTAGAGAGTGDGTAGAGAGTPGVGDGTGGAGDGTTPGTDLPVEDIGPPPDEACEVSVPATSQVPRMLNREYDAAVRDLLGVTGLESAGNQAPSTQLVEDLEGSITSTAWNAYMNVADDIAAQVMGGALRSNFIACEPAEAGCLQSTIETFGRKAFRRPLTTDEVASFMTFDNLEPKGTPEEVAEAILYAFLSSPSFIMLPELSEEAGTVAGTVQLSDYEIATRLSLLIWGSIPDDALNAAADAGELSTEAQIMAQAQRMLQDSAKTGPLLADFHRTYAGIRFGTHWLKDLDHDSTKYPAFSSKEEVNPAMLAEIDAYFADVAFNGSFADLFLSNVGYVNAATAPIYGVQGDFGPELQRVELDAMQRPGFLTRIGFLASHSHEGDTAPILRGAYISKEIIGVDPGVPDPAFATQEPPEMDYTSNRQYTEAKTSPPECAGCHATVVNPPGFVMEAYDSVGGWQTTDPLGDPVNTTADVLFADGPKTINNPFELMTELARGPAAKENYAEKWISYAFKRNAEENDACTVQGLSTKLANDDYKITNLLADLSQVQSFRLRTQGN